MLEGKLAETQIEWREGNSACVVLAAEGYPQKPRTGDVITGLNDPLKMENVTIFHAGTSVIAGKSASTVSGSEAEHVRPSFVTAGGA